MIKTIRNIKKVVNNENKRYDITVENTECFFADNLLVHNSRTNAVVKNGVVSFFTRNGRSFTLSEKMTDEVLRLTNNGMIDGELLLSDGDGDYLPRKKGNGIFNSITKYDETVSNLLEKKQTPAIIKKLEKLKSDYIVNIDLVRFVVWDLIPIEVFEGQSEPIPYHQGFNSLRLKLQSMMPDLITLVNSQEVDSEEEALWFYQSQINQGHEGAILKNKNHLWSKSRSNDLLKMKAEVEMDLIITGVGEGAGRLSGKLGKFQCVSEDGEIEVSVGTGLSDQQRVDYFTNDMIGKVIEVCYNEIIEKDGSDKKSLFLPVFKFMREDKSLLS